MTDATPAQHAAVLGDHARHLPQTERPSPGPIAVLPDGDTVPFFAAAIAEAGGSVAELGPHTRGLVWLSSQHPEDLERSLSAHPGIGWVQLPWAGVDSLASVIAAHPNVLWTSAKGAYAQPVAEHALTLLLALLRVLPERVRATSWSEVSSGRSLYGRHVVVIGAGGIAVELSRLLAVFRVRVSIVRRRAAPMSGVFQTVTRDQLIDVLADADAVIVAAASTQSTQQLLGAAELAALPAGALVVNVGRGALIDTDALVSALTSGHLGGAGLDVTDPEPLPDGHPLWSSPNCIITPHTADTPAMTGPLLAERIRANTRAFCGRADERGAFVGVVDPGLGY